VILIARKATGDQGLNQAVAKLDKLFGPGKAIALAADLSKPEQVESVVAQIRATEPAVDILIANAAATYGGPFESTPDSFVQKVLDLNVRSIFNLVKAMVPLLRAAATPGDPSRVVVVGAGAGNVVATTGDTSIISYGVSKAAAHHLARWLALELGPKGIAVNAIAPGFFPSKLANGLIANLGGFDAIAAGNPLGRVGAPEDIAGIMVFLCSRAGSWMNGAVIQGPDGGANVGGTRIASKGKL